MCMGNQMAQRQTGRSKGVNDVVLPNNFPANKLVFYSIVDLDFQFWDALLNLQICSC